MTAEGDGGADTCSMCQRIEASEGGELLLDDHWFAVASQENPGWVWLATRRHGAWSWGLSDGETASYGDVIRRITRAVREASSADRVYVLALGENSIHYHMLVIPRLPQLGDAVRRAIRAAGADVREPGRAADADRRLRSALVAP